MTHNSKVGEDRTKGVLTTQKLQVLLDSGLVPAVQSRRCLAHALTAAGEPITVHGVEAWFKNVDSNYAVPRESLSATATSYPIPRRRRAGILELFGLTESVLELSDTTFMDHIGDLQAATVD